MFDSNYIDALVAKSLSMTRDYIVLELLYIVEGGMDRADV